MLRNQPKIELGAICLALCVHLACVATHRGGSSAASLPGAAPQIAVTFDDLPAHGPLPPGITRLDIASQTVAALRAAHVPSSYGFTNGHLVEQAPADAQVLQVWQAAGNPLGNHTWSHLNLNQHTLQEFQADVARNEPLLAERMKDQPWHWLRFPYLAEGDTPEKRAGVRSYLLQRGYRIAGVTMSFGDYLYNDPYARCRAKGDGEAIALLERAYLAAADETIAYDRGLSNTLFGRDIPYVLLMHIGALEARLLPQLLALYRSRGFQFVALEQAESDRFYRQDTDLTLPPGPDSLEGMMRERGLPLPPHSISPPDFDKMCR